MRILYLANIRVPSEKAHTFQIMRMCAAFASAGTEVTLVVPSRRNPIVADPFDYYGLPKNFTIRRVASWDAIGCRWLPGHLQLGLTLWSYARAVRREVLQSESFDVCYTREAWLLPRLATGRRKLLAYEAHDLPGDRWVGRYRRALGLPDVIVATSDALASKLRTLGADPGKIVVERNGADPELFAPRDKGVARRKLGLVDDKPIALYVGQLQTWKGISTLLAASALLASDVQTVIVGGLPAEIAAWQKKFPDSPARFVGRVPHAEVPEWIAASDICVVPTATSTREAQLFTSPIKLYEYLAAGRPVVASDLSSIREIAGSDVLTFVKPDDPAALADGIRRALADTDQERRIARGRELVTERYSWDARVKRILELLGKSHQ